MDTDHLLYQRETVSQTQKRISGPQKEKNKTGTGTNELIQSNIGRLILLKKKKKSIHQEPLSNTGILFNTL